MRAPPKFDGSDNGLINGPRSTPLRIHRHSHAIHKSSSLPALSLSPAKPKPKPVIIYTKSPKIIHTHAHDFMALVQKLTGLHRAEDDQSDNKDCANNNKNIFKGGVCNYENSGYDDEKDNSKSNDNSMINNSPYLTDVTYLNPSSSDLFCSSMSRISPMIQGPGPITPSLMDYVKWLPDY
ncbi:VQ motif-containing protein [Striga asiatica]|uniref:VQ motif-containing protein n=1 Tax=Striga asiatica TaxID=4170 RepID=A0A5A7QHE7_STRAF|nr:VQ motif-containing protein [Striga asiatica]